MKKVKISGWIVILGIFLFSVNASAQMIVTVAGNGTQGFNSDGILATSSELNDPYNVAIDDSGNIFIADYDNNRIRKVSITNGIISTIAGTGIAGYSGDTGLATLAKIRQPRGIVVDGSGNVFFCDQGNYRIRKIAAGSGIITTVAGTGSSGHSGDEGLATLAKISWSHSLDIDPNGDLVIADTWNHCIRKVIMSTGIIRNVAGVGTAGFSGDSSLAVLAKLKFPTGIAIDGSGNIYMTDQENNRIRMVNASDSLIYTVAGIGTMGYSGDNGPALLAQFNKPVGLDVDSAGVIYVSDSYNNRIRKIDQAGVITTISGTNTAGYNGDNISCFLAELNGPSDMRLDKNGNIFFCDGHNYRVRKIRKSLVGVEEVINNENIVLFPNPVTDKLSVELKGNAIERASVYNVLGELIFSNTISPLNYQSDKTDIDVSTLQPGVYFVKLDTQSGTGYSQFIKE